MRISDWSSDVCSSDLAQFVVSKTVDVKKSHVGLTFIRDSTVRHESFTERSPKLGGLVEFYRPPDRVLWTPTGVNVPDYPKLAQLWWQQIGDVHSGARSEGRRVGKEGFMTGRSRWSPYHQQKTNHHNKS